MAKAFVFMNINVDSEAEVLKKLREVPEIKECYFVYGVYDGLRKLKPTQWTISKK